jgi:hypothetical protein
MRSPLCFPTKIDGPEWRFQASNGYVWRMATAGDLPRIQELWANQESRIGAQDKPDLFDLPVLLTLVAENAGGVVVEALYIEAVAEFVSIGTERGALRTVHEMFRHFRDFCGQRKIRLARVNVPRRLARMVGRFLPGLDQTEDQLAQFVFRVRK